MFKHGFLLRSSYSIISRRYFSSISKQSYSICSLSIRESTLGRQFLPSVKHYSKAAVIEDAVPEDEKTLAESEVKVVNSGNKVKDTLKQMIIENSVVDEDEEDHGTRKKWKTEQEKVLYEEIEKGNTLSSAEWSDVRKRILEPTGYINETNVDSSIIGVCMSEGKLATGRSYLNYLEAIGQEPNVATISKFFKLCNHCSSEVDEEVKGAILSLYDSLRNRYPVLDAGTCESALQGLALTSRWREGVSLLDDIRLTCTPNTPSYSTLIRAAFDNNEPELGWELLNQMLLDNRKPAVYVYESWLNYSHRFAAGDMVAEEKLVNRLLHFIGNNDIRLSEDGVKAIRYWFEYCTPLDSNWDAEFTTVDMRGQCKSCFRNLSPIALRQDEFEQLRTAFMDKALVGTNVFLKSTPEELAEFQEFVKKTAPYDIVIDGLNVGYSGGTGKGNPRTFSRMLQSVVRTFAQRNQKILVLGRKHMSNWPRENMEYVYANAEVFLAENLSQDDPYLLYAAMYSGLGTSFISRDLMRSHAFLLGDPKLQSYFRRWQKQHQYQVQYVSEGGNVRMKLPLTYSTSTQQNKSGGWHVPYDLDSVTTRSQGLNPPFQWLCVRRNSHRYGEMTEMDEGRPRRFQHREEDGEEGQRSRFQPRNDGFRGRFQQEDGEGGQRSRFQSRNDGFQSKFQQRDESSWGEERKPRPRYQARDRDSGDRYSQPERDTFDELFKDEDSPGNQRQSNRSRQFSGDSDDETERPTRRLGTRSKASKNDWND